MEEIKIIFEDENVLVLEKPAGWVTTTEGNSKTNSKSVQGWLSENRSNNLKREGIVHRLDKGTSGLLLAAKNESALENIKKQFKDRTTRKKYWALAGGDLPREGEINMPTGRSPYGFGKFAVVWNGKPSKTVYRVESKYLVGGKIFSLVDIDLKTGRTHQIRVHFRYLGWPLAGDTVYGGNKIGQLSRPFLHAYHLEFDDPTSGERKIFEIALPDDLQVILKENEKID